MLTLLLVLQAQAHDLTVGGTCPGTVEVSVTGLSPGVTIGLVTAAEAGAEPLPSGPCVGEVLGLSATNLKYRGRATDDDADGVIDVAADLPSSLCGQLVQSIVLTDCSMSEPADIPVSEIDAPMFAASSSGASGLWAIDPAAGTVVYIADPGRPLTGLAFDLDGVLYGIEGGSNSAVRNPSFGRVSIVDPTTGALETIAETGQSETSLVWYEGQLYAADENSAFVSIDPVTGEIDDIGASLDGLGFGYALASTDTTMWRVSDTALYQLEADGSSDFIAAVTGTAGGWGGGATFHEGELWVAVDDARGGTALMTVDLETGVATSTGLRIPDPSIDALASRTP